MSKQITVKVRAKRQGVALFTAKVNERSVKEKESGCG